VYRTRRSGSGRTTGNAPSFRGLRPASRTSSISKRSNRATDTAHEVVLRRALWRIGVRFRKNVRSLPGKPDIVFLRAKVAVFCDGDFWHGRHWSKLKSKLRRGSNADYWTTKIQSNIERDRRNRAVLQKAGWKVIRLWESDIKRDPQSNAALVKSVVEKRAH
jgi:DNA mismatch endonuclease (patch repair protein)